MSSIESQTHTLKDGTHITLRTARRDDAAPLLAFIKTISADAPYLVSLPEEHDRTEAQSAEWIEKHLAGEGQLAVIAEHEGRIIGFIDFKNGTRKRLQHSGDFGMSVARDWRGLGLGTVLLQTLLGWAAANPIIEKVALAVMVDNTPAVALYRKMGFIEEGRRIKEVKRGTGRYDDEFLMYKWVK